MSNPIPFWKKPTKCVYDGKIDCTRFCNCMYCEKLSSSIESDKLRSEEKS